MNRDIAFLRFPKFVYQLFKDHGVNTTEDLLNLPCYTVEEWDGVDPCGPEVQIYEDTMCMLAEEGDYKASVDNSFFDDSLKEVTILEGLFPILSKYEYYNISLKFESYNNGTKYYEKEYFSSLIVKRLKENNIESLYQLLNLKYSDIKKIFENNYDDILELFNTLNRIIEYELLWPDKDLFDVIINSMYEIYYRFSYTKFTQGFNYSKFLTYAFKAVLETCKHEDIDSNSLIIEIIYTPKQFVTKCMKSKAMSYFWAEDIKFWLHKKNSNSSEKYIISYDELKKEFSDLISYIGDDTYDDILYFLVKNNHINTENDEIFI